MENTYIKSHKTRYGGYTESTTEDELGNVVRKRRVYYPLEKLRVDGKLIFLQYNDRMEPLWDICHYLNKECNSESEKTRSFKASVLRRYISFMDLIGFQYNDLKDQYVIDRLASYFRGEDYRSDTNPDFISHVSANNYLSVIRNFVRTCGVSMGLKNELYSSLKDLTVDGKRFKNKSPSSLRTNPHNQDMLRPFLYPDEFKKLVDFAKERLDYLALIVFYLMYFYALRIGECLGITEEDLVIMRKDYAPSPTLFLRNRLSDCQDQYAKGLFHPKTVKDYNGRYYPSQKVVLSMDFYEKLTGYVEHVKKNLKAKGIYDRAEADCISNSYKKENGANHYIFRNVYGKPLTQQAWNKRLKEYFLAAGIPLDVGVKRDNLNHRFRHGCAMYYLRFAEKKMAIEELAAFMRHASPSTTCIYLKVSFDEKIALRQEFSEEMQKAIPLLIDD